MSDPGGTTLDRKLVFVGEGEAASVIATLAEALGHRVLRRRGDRPVDLEVVEATRPEELPPPGDGQARVAVAPRRLRAGEAQRLLAHGAGKVLDAEACLLEAAFALTDMLFSTCREQRRYGEAYAKIAVTYVDAGGVRAKGWLTGLSRRGGRVIADVAPPEGETITLSAEIGPWEVPLRGRVACVDGGPTPGFGLDFVLDPDPLVPCLDRFLGDAMLTRAPPRRSASSVPA